MHVEYITLEIVDPPEYGFLLQSSDAYHTTYFKVNAAGNPTSVKMYYRCRLSAYNNTLTNHYICELDREGSSNYYSADCTFSYYWKYPHLNFSPLVVINPEVVGVATYSDNSIFETQLCTICWATLEDYESYDTTFYCNSPTDNSFRQVLTGDPDNGVPTTWTYNCLSYALGLEQDGWIWPWYGSPTYQQVIAYLALHEYEEYSFSSLSGAQIIYYSGGHFAKVAHWDDNGFPDKIESISCWIIFSCE